MIISPKRGFEVSEYENRLDNIQKLMHESRMDAILLTTQVDIEYYTGFKTQFFQSPTRPWYVLIPSSNKPKAIIPTIGESGMRGTWLDDIQTWTSPNPEDDGISLLLSTIKSLTKKYKCLGVPKSQESVLRMPLDDYENLVKSLDGIEIKDANKILRQVRLIKSTAEIDKIKHICQLTSQGFSDLTHLLKAGESEHENCKRFKQHLLSLGVDDTPYMVAGSGKDGYGSIIMGPGDKIIEEGDLLIVDTGSVFDSYFCDFDRNYAFGFICDGGIRRGTHVLKALALGANACSMGRPYLYGLAAAGQAGVEAALSRFEAELKRNMMLMGINKLSQLNHSKIRRR